MKISNSINVHMLALLSRWARSKIYLQLLPIIWNLVGEKTSFFIWHQLCSQGILPIFDSLCRRMKKRQMTLGWRLVWFNNPNKFHLIFNLNPRIFFCVLKFRRILLYDSKTKRLMQKKWLQQWKKSKTYALFLCM